MKLYLEEKDDTRPEMMLNNLCRWDSWWWDLKYVWCLRVWVWMREELVASLVSCSVDSSQEETPRTTDTWNTKTMRYRIQVMMRKECFCCLLLSRSIDTEDGDIQKIHCRLWCGLWLLHKIRKRISPSREDSVADASMQRINNKQQLLLDCRKSCNQKSRQKKKVENESELLNGGRKTHMTRDKTSS